MNVPTMLARVTCTALLGIMVAAPAAQAQQAPMDTSTTHRFQFGPGHVAPGFTQVSPKTVYTAEHGFGFEPGSAVTAVDRGGKDALHAGYCTGAQPFLFSVTLPEGDYNVTVTLGDRTGPSTTTVKAESRRLMLEKVETTAGKFERRTFTVNVRTPQIATGGSMHLKPREVGPPMNRNWDGKLTLEFGNTRPCLDAIEITRADKAVTVFLMGDSTVTDQPDDPWCAWGQMLPRFFQEGVAVANYAESGESLRSTMGAQRLDKVLSVIKPGDYMFIQFGHNDQKEHGEGIGAFTSYKTDLIHFVTEARKRGALPVLVTSMNRRRFDEQGKIVPTLGDYPEAVRQAAKEQNVPLIDLNAMSKTLFEAMGPDGTLKAFVHYPANTFPGQTAELKDNTHFNTYGADQLAKCIVEGIKADKLGLVKYLTGDVPPFDPAHPDPVGSWNLPLSPAQPVVKPDGS